MVVTKEIMIRSDAYKYDRILYRYEAARKALRERYENSEGQLSKDQSKETRLAFYHLRSAIPKVISDREAHASLQRWKQFKVLRRLYVELLPDFDFSHIPGEEGIKPLWDGALPLQTDSLQARTPVAATELGETFKARFHKALSLHTIAMTLRQLGFAAQYKRHDTRNPGQLAQTIACTAWEKGPLAFEEVTIDVTKMEQIEGLEVFDFLYGFLLPKIFSRDTFLSWNSPFYTTALARDSTEFRTQAFREAYFYPSDIADLINHNIWEKDSKYPEDKAAYLKNLGCLENLTVTGGFDWWVPFSRKPMLMGAVGAEMFVEILKGDIVWRWYDDLRIKNGSPFELDSSWPGHEESRSDVEQALTKMIQALNDTDGNSNEIDGGLKENADDDEDNNADGDIDNDASGGVFGGVDGDANS